MYACTEPVAWTDIPIPDSAWRSYKTLLGEEQVTAFNVETPYPGTHIIQYVEENLPGRWSHCSRSLEREEWSTVEEDEVLFRAKTKIYVNKTENRMIIMKVGFIDNEDMEVELFEFPNVDLQAMYTAMEMRCE